MLAETTTVSAVLVAILVAVLGRRAPTSFLAALAALRAVVRRGHTTSGPAAIEVWLRRMGIARQERADLAQEVVSQALRSWPTFNPDRGTATAQANFVRWLNGIARNVVQHHRERAHHRREVLRAEPAGPDVRHPSPSAHEQLERAMARAAMLELLQRVPFRDRVLLVGHDIDGVSLAELAEQLGVSQAAIRRHRAAALRRLKERPSRRDELAAWLAARRAWRG